MIAVSHFGKAAGLLLRSLCRGGLVVTLVAGVLVGCSTFKKWFPSKLPVAEILFQVEERANEDQPVALDLVMVRDEGLLQKLDGLAARDWFARRHQFKLDYPDGAFFFSWELVPGQPMAPFELSSDARKTLGAFVFADYRTPGDHRARVDRIDRVLIRVGPKEFSAERFAP